MGVIHTTAMQKAIKEFQSDFERSFGKNTLIRGKSITPYETISTGSIALDIATGVGGYVKGRLHQVWAPQDVGKTTMMLIAVAEAQKADPGAMVAYIDVENKIDETWADKLGVDRERWFLYHPQNAEDVADSVKKFLQNPLFSMVIVDSVGAMMGRIEQEKQADEDVVAVTARIVTRMVKHATFFAPRNKAVVIFVNQVRAAINRGGFGSTTELPGGWALKHGTTMQFKMRLTDKRDLKVTFDGDAISVGRERAVTVERNKCAPAGRTAMVLLKTVDTPKFGKVGIDQVDEAVTEGKKMGVLKRDGSSYILPMTGEKISSEENVRQYLARNLDEVADIRQRCVALRASTIIVDDEPDLSGIPEEQLAEPAAQLPESDGELQSPYVSL